MSSNLLHVLQTLPKSERLGVLQQRVVEEFKHTLLMEPGETVPLDVSLFDLGLTSLGLETLKQRFEKTFGCAINSAEMFNNPTAGHFLQHFERHLLGGSEVQSQAAQEGETEEQALANAVLADFYLSHNAAS